MARSRNIKPALFKNEVLGVADPIYTLCFEGLWLLADRDGRLEDRPLRIKAEIFPYREFLDIEAMLDWLSRNDFIIRYQNGKNRYIQIINFAKHQNPHKNEAASEIPEYSATCKSSDFIGTDPDSIGCARADSLSLDSLSLDSLSLDSRALVPSADDTGDYSFEFEQFWKAYPKRDGGNSKRAAFKAWKARLRAGVKSDDLILSASRYAEQMTAQGRIGTSFVKQASTFLGPDDHWQEVMTSNVHPIAIARNGKRPALNPGEFYDVDWDDRNPSTHKIRHVDTHDPTTGYAWAWLKKQTWYKP